MTSSLKLCKCQTWTKLKERYFQKWKDEEEAKAQAFRNERLAERQRLNGGYTKGGH